MTKKQLEALRDVHKVQGSDGNWNYDPYMHGLYNGLELALSIAEGREPDFREAPTDGWLQDKPHDNNPVCAEWDPHD